MPNIETTFWDKTTNTLIASSTKVSGNITGNTHNKDWRKVTHTFTPPVGVTDLQLRFKNTNNDTGANDFAIDDILVTQDYDTCTTTLTATVAPKVTRAFAGVTKLIGCGTGANANKAEVTIANVQGGTGAYEYNFDGTWVATNTGWLAAGTHTVSVRAAGTGNSCAYDMSVTVPNPIAQPTIKTEVFYGCDGRPTLKIGVQDPDPELTYMYSLDGGAYTTTYVYSNIATGTHQVRVQYEYSSVPSPFLLLREDFGVGPEGLSISQVDPNARMSSHYTALPIQQYCGTPNASVNGYYITKGTAVIANTCWGGYVGGPYPSNVPYDNTPSTTPNGRYMMIDLKSPGVVYEKDIYGVLPNSKTVMSVDFYNLILAGMPGRQNPLLTLQVFDKKTAVKIAESQQIDVPQGSTWSKSTFSFVTPSNTTEITFKLYSHRNINAGNDLALDNIEIYQVPKACGQVVSATKVVTANNQDIPAFTVSKTYDCATGKGVLTVTPTATTGFTYTYTLGSTTYTSTTATFTGLDLEQTYTVSVSYQAVSNTVTLLNEDFGAGTEAVKSSYTAKNLYFNENRVATYNAYNANGQFHNHPIYSGLQEGEYTIAHNLLTGPFSSVWRTPNDHTGNTNGRIFFVNPSASPLQTIYAREVNVLPNQALTFSAYFYNLLINTGSNDPKVRLTVYKNKTDYENNSTPLKSFISNEIPPNANNPNAWEQKSVSLTATEVGARSSVYVVVSMVNPVSGGHDMAMDDIKVTQVIAPCTTSVTATLTKGDIATPTLTLPANLSVICSAPTASATISSWIASATATSTCGTATVTHNYVAPANLCNVTGGAVTVTFSTTDPFGNVVTATRVISFATMTLTVTPTALSVPNGVLGGTTSSVVPNITLGGVASPSTNSVTISFSGLPTGVTSTTGGRLIVAPNTPAGSHTITYRVCETAGNNNCKTVNTQLVIGAATPTVSTETFTASTTTATVVPGTIGNILTNASVGTRSATAGVGGNVTITLTHTPTIPNAPQINPSTGSVTVSSNTPPGVYTITYTLCSAVSTCVPGVATITVPQLKPYIPNTTITHSGTQTTTRNILDGGKVNGGTQSATVGIGGTVTITSVTNPTPRTPGAPVPTLNPATGIVTVPPTTPNGTYTISYTVCTTATPTNCTTGVTTVVVANVTPTVVPDAFTASTTTATVVPGVIGNVLTNDRVGTQSATTGVGGNVTINVTRTPTTPNAPVLDASTGSVTVSGNTPAGVYSISYEVCNGALCTAATLTVTVPQLKPYIPAANITHSGTTTTTYTVTTGGSVKGGTQSATTGTGGTVTITNVVNPTPHTPGAPVPSLNPNNGVITVPPTTPNGVYTITYDVCTTATPTACSSHVATITVGSVTPTVVPDAFTASTTTATVVPGVIGNVLTNDRVGTQSATTGVGGNVTINVTRTPTTPNAPVLDASTGSVTVSGNTPAGVYSISYEVCNGALCTAATLTVTVPQLKPYIPAANITHSGTTTTTYTVTTGGSVKGGTQSATTGTGGTVTITNVVNPTPHTPGAPVPSLNPNNGVITVPPTTPNGVYTITYDVCTTATPTACSSHVATITVGSVTPTEIPEANDITAYTRINTPVTVGVTSSTTVTVSIPSQPANGTAVSNGDGTITYTPNNGFKGTDSFEYSLCNAAGCRTATISVRVTSELIIYNGVSIGGSDKNNHFHIEGIENYPNNTVRIYNRWGVKVFEMSGYNNTTKVFKGVSDARATLEASDNLPQGTYYYIIEYVDEHNKTQTETGWLYLKKN